MCDVENLRTLCTGCHKQVTKQQAHTRAARRRATKAAAGAGHVKGQRKLNITSLKRNDEDERPKRGAKRQKVILEDSDDDEVRIIAVDGEEVIEIVEKEKKKATTAVEENDEERIPATVAIDVFDDSHDAQKPAANAGGSRRRGKNHQKKPT